MSFRHLTTLIGVLLGIFASADASLQSTDFSQKSKPATLKVLLQKQVPELTLEVKGRHYIYNPLDGTEISWGLLSKRFPVKAEPYGIHWGEKFPGSYQLRFVPGDSQSSILVNGIQYRGCVEIYLTDGKFNVINEVDVESYLKSTLSTEFSSPFNEEVISAISIVARTNAYFISQRNKHAFWHVTAEEVGYQGSAILSKPHVEKAVDATYHAILTYNDAPFAATWTQNSAGRTVDFAAIFRKSVSTPPGVPAPIALKDRKQFQWSCSLPKTALASATDLSKVTSVDLYVAPQSEKVYAIKVSGDTHVKDYDFSTFQRIIGKHKLRSNDFKVQVKGDEIVFTGYGEGPGVGLCLYSAKALAEKGEKAPQILSTFFPDTKLEKVK
jgi:stage II sporulation protein D